MKRVSLFIFATLVIVIMGCSQNGQPHIVGDTPPISEHFLDDLITAESLNLTQIESNNGQLSPILIKFEQLTKLSAYEKSQIYEQIGDTSFNRVKHGGDRAVVNNFTSIDIISSAQFGQIPAGESLASKVVFYGATIKPYLDSGYTTLGNWSVWGDYPEDGWFGSNDCYEEWTPIVKKISEMTSDDLQLLGYRTPTIELHFTEVPEVKEHTFTVTITDTIGRKITASVDYVFE